MRRDDSGEFWWDMLVGAIFGAGSQLISDVVTFAVEGEFTFSPVSSYIGAAVGGALGAITPGGAVAGDMVGAAVTTIVGMVGNNIENTIAGNNQIYTFEEMFYTTTINVMLAGLTSTVVRNSDSPQNGNKLTEILFNTKMGKNIMSGVFPAVVTGVRNSTPFSKLSNAAHVWERFR